MPSSFKKIGVITVVYKFPSRKLEAFIRNIEKQGISRKSIYIKDNTLSNVGYGGAINTILKCIIDRYDYFFILNPDTKLRKNCIKILFQTMQANESIGIIGPRIINKDGSFTDGGSLDKLRYSSILIKKIKTITTQIKKVAYVSGSAMFIKREVFKKIGLFHEDYFLFYEELDFCFRAKQSDFQVLINSKANIYHEGSSIIGEVSPAAQYYLSRNHLLFVERFAPFALKLREFARIPKTLFEAKAKPYELLGIKDYFLRRFGRNFNIKAKADL